MARQMASPVQFEKSVRDDEGVLMSSGRAGVVIPVGYMPLLRGDSASGRVSVDVNLAEMPRPLLNAVFCNVQAWFVPKSIHPQFAGKDEFYASYAGTMIKALGQADRSPPPYFLTGTKASLKDSTFFKTLGIHLPSTGSANVDLVDAFNLIYNFRLAAHSTKLQRKKYFSENAAEALALPRAFWPSGRYKNIVPDYESNIVIGALDLDVTAGIIPIHGMMRGVAAPSETSFYEASLGGTQVTNPGTPRPLYVDITKSVPRIIADMAETTVTTSLADIDKARTTQSFAKLRQAMAGNNSTGFVSDAMILAHLMQGLAVSEEMFKRPWLLDSKRVPFGFAERFSTSGDALDKSVTTGRTAVELSLNVPASQDGGLIVVTMEVLPERLDERQYDAWMACTMVDDLPNALRDIQIPEPVDWVPNKRIDAAHASPDGVYGYEPLNDKWNRSFTRLGGAFYQPTPGTPVTEQRMGIWQASVVNPAFSADHWLAPANFPHYVFSDTNASAFEFVVRHSLKIVGNTQIGDVLAEDNNEYADTAISASGGR